MPDLTRQHILAEIRRTAELNGGKPLGRRTFLDATGIRETDWQGKYWARWGDAVVEAGFAPNRLIPRIDDDLLFQKLIDLTGKLGHYPTQPELRLARRNDSTVPDAGTFLKFGSKREQILRVLSFCEQNGSPEPATTILRNSVPAPQTTDDFEDGDLVPGFVYLLKTGKNYKVGRTNDVGRRTGELAIQLPERAEFVHSIRTDDMIGIEAYWHQRFASKRQNGEWFLLSASDVRAFKSRKSM